MAHAYPFGIEEEFFLADARSRGTPRGTTQAFHAAAQDRFDSVDREMLQAQVEICSPPAESFAQARAHLAERRRGLAGLGREHGLLVFAAGTHPTATWRHQMRTEAPRYREILEDLRMVGRRAVVCGLHVHVEVPEPEARIGLMNRLLPFLPLLLALSAGSPFWQQRETGLAGYRLRAYAELPRTGLPELFADEADFARYVRTMTESGAIDDASFLWWHIRPSVKYPTLELRIADSCTRLDDAVTIAALFRCLCRHLRRHPTLGAGLSGADRGLVMENLWRAQRDGVAASLIDGKSPRAVPVPELVGSLLDRLAPDAEALGCTAECARAAVIAAQGTSATRQTAIYAEARAAGAGARAALGQVVDWLAAETEAA
ncbi:carboxylate-amine ligase [Methylobacterium sp. A54F]